jgi:glycosyltransferase involved in cell wall biosynthesis
MSATGALTYVTPWLGDGGVERALEIEAPWLARRGHRVGVVSWTIPERLGGEPNPVLRTLRAHGVQVRRAPAYGRFQLLQRAAQVAAWTLRDGASVLVGHELMGTMAAMLAKRLLGGRVRVVAEVHNASEMYHDVHPRQLRLARALYRRADAVRAVSDSVARDAIVFFGLDARRVTTVYNAFRLETIRARAAEDLPPAHADLPPFVVACGRLVAMKGFADLIGAFSRVRRRTTCKLVILGEGRERESLARHARALDVADDVLLPGFTDNPFAYFARARLFVLSSRFGEAFSRVLVEAMACGVPVIATRCRWGPEEVLANGACGRLSEVGDVDMLAELMTEALRHPERVQPMVAAGRRRAEEFSEERLLPRLERVHFGTAGGAAA